MDNGGRNPGDHAGAAPPEKNASLVISLGRAQNADGGWPYHCGSSWTEPTALSLLALGPANPLSARGYAWLRARQRPAGGWAPQPSVEQATWVTSVVALLPAETIGESSYTRAIGWIMEQTGQESSFWFRLRDRMLGAGDQRKDAGWPWFPGTAAWVTPTSLAILGLKKWEKRNAAAEVRQRIESGRRFLLARMCADGGWNHGSNRALGYDGPSYPETTGVALMALAHTPNLERSLATAERHWQQCRSAEGAAWLKLGLLAHGKKTNGWPVKAAPRNVRDMALCELAERAEKGQNAFLD